MSAKPKKAAPVATPRREAIRRVIRVGTAYQDGRGRYVFIMGPARRDDGLTALWSLAGDHYTPQGELIHASSTRGPYVQLGSDRNLGGEIQADPDHLAAFKDARAHA